MNELGNTPADKNYKPSGISKAEERALEAYPVQMVSGPIGYEEPKFDINAFGRDMFAEGYEAAEKDLALTWEDIRKIVVISEDVFEEGNNLSVQEFYEEVLKRYLEAKK